MNELALFSGAGGGILGGKLLGWRTICGVEFNTFCSEILMQRQNEGHLDPFPIWDDVRTFNGYSWQGIVDVVSGGFPCQPFSTATHGIKTAINLWPEMLRIVGEVKPEFVFAENVSAKAIEQAHCDCERIGYRASSIALSAKDLGADHSETILASCTRRRVQEITLRNQCRNTPIVESSSGCLGKWPRRIKSG